MVEAVPFLGVEEAPPQVAEIDLAPCAEHTHHELVHRHFKGIDGDGHVVLHGGAHGHVQGKGGLAHRGAGRHDDEVGGLEPGGHLVEAVVARGHARDHFLALHALGEVLEDAIDELLGTLEDLTRSPFGD